MAKSKILIIEDERVLTEVMKSKLENDGYSVKVANDGQEGYAKIKSWKPDLVLLDLVMPKMNGYDVLEKLSNEGDLTPIIVISNSGDLTEIEKSKKLGAVDCLVKANFNPDEVLNKICYYLKQCKIKHVETTDVLKAKILLVEDEPYLREICSKKLIKEGYDVMEVSDGAEVYEKVLKYRPDLILLDMVLPGVSGFEIIELIRKTDDKNIRNTIIVSLSNLGQKEEIDRAIKLGANDYLIKAHFTPDQLIQKISTIKFPHNKR
jgi:DNA-binding response OmpR family regulator